MLRNDFWAGLVIGLIFAVLAGLGVCAIGTKAGERSIQNEAIKRGFARYVITNEYTGAAVFVWREK